MGVHLVINFNILPERRDSFIAVLKGVKASLPTVPGCQGVQVYHHLDAPLNFTLVETWDSREVHGQHVQHLVASGQWDGIASHFATEPVSSYAVELAA
ncbi:MAG: hypothetical protein RLZZ618_3534 [Pseudomonadota bacterium]